MLLVEPNVLENLTTNYSDNGNMHLKVVRLVWAIRMWKPMFFEMTNLRFDMVVCFGRMSSGLNHSTPQHTYLCFLYWCCHIVVPALCSEIQRAAITDKARFKRRERTVQLERQPSVSSSGSDAQERSNEITIVRNFPAKPESRERASLTPARCVQRFQL